MLVICLELLYDVNPADLSHSIVSTSWYTVNWNVQLTTMVTNRNFYVHCWDTD